ncbi:MAG: Flp pilus assembly protein CpaB [Bryobacteraceae bacterium]|nr:Flp pilus assembly protein CpaB [Bryobacteraceae bacterium]
MDRQRILLIFGGAALCAALLTWFLWSRTAAPKSEAMAQVWAASRDLSAGTRLTKAHLKQVTLAAKDAPVSAIRDPAAALDRPLIYPVSANEVITTAKIASIGGIEGVPALIAAGKRAVSVAVADASGAAGLIQPRAHVDVLFTRAGSMSEALTTTILQDIAVLSVGRVTEAQNLDTKGPRPATQSVTLLVTPEEAGKLELAKNQGKISLALRNPLDRSQVADPQPVTGDLLDPYLNKPRKGRGVPANLRDDRAWNDLTAQDAAPKKPAPPPAPPKTVIDVYRGDKHVQEVFDK